MNASTDLIPFEFNAHPFIDKLSVVTVAFDTGASKQLFAWRFLCTVIFLVTTVEVPSLAIIWTFKVFTPLVILFNSKVESNPHWLPLKYPEYILLTSVLVTP